MTNTLKHRALSICRWLFVFLAATYLLQVQAAGQTIDAASAKEAISSLDQFQKDIKGMRSVVNKPLGPYPIKTQCTWCSQKAWWGFGFCTQNTTQTWDFTVDFNWTRQRLDRVLKRAEQNAGTFSSSYAPTQAWLDGLPKFSASFEVTADVILAVQRDIKAGKGPTDQQRQTVAQALQKLTDDLSSSSEQLKGGTKALAASLQRQSAYRQSIKQAIDGADRSAQTELQRIGENARSKAHPDCLKNLINNHFNPIKADFSRSIQEISAAFQRLEASSRKAEKSLAALLGLLVNSQTELQMVLKLLKAAENDQLGSFIERLHLTAAKKQWKDLASF